MLAMSKTVALLGRQPALGLAELEALYGEIVSKLTRYSAILDIEPDAVDFKRLGGSIKLAKILTILDATSWHKVETYLMDEMPRYLSNLDEGKFTLGLSAIDMGVSPKRINATALSIKKIIKNTGRPCRVIPNKSAELSSATVLHNKLYSSHAWELIIINTGTQTYILQTTHVQDINAYSARDQARPMRDAKVGMLPPKLAQIIINLATASNHKIRSVLDPFCGTGVLLQEALLDGYNAYGTDIDERMIEYTQANLGWLFEHHDLESKHYLIEIGDATNYQWHGFDTIACETYLGRPFSAYPGHKVLQGVISDVDTIHRKFLRNVAKQTKPGFRMCIAVPAWHTRHGFERLKTLDSLEELGYTRAVFNVASVDDMIYHREGQMVGRELVVLIRK